MTDNLLPFTPDDKLFFLTIRGEIVFRPDLYREGVEYLASRFSRERLLAEDLKTQGDFKGHPLEVKSRLATASQAASVLISPDCERDERGRIEQEVLQQLSALPDKDRGYWLSNCLIQAFSTLLYEGIETPDDDLNPYDLEKVKAVLCLTWLLTDHEADTEALGKTFGPWGDNFEQQLSIKGRALARLATLDEPSGESRANWLILAQRAWQVLLVTITKHEGKVTTTSRLSRNTPPSGTPTELATHPANLQPSSDGEAVLKLIADRASTEPRLIWLRMFLDENPNATLRQIEAAAKSKNHTLKKSNINNILRREKWIGHPPRGIRGKTSTTDPSVIAQSMSDETSRRSF